MIQIHTVVMIAHGSEGIFRGVKLIVKSKKNSFFEKINGTNVIIDEYGGCIRKDNDFLTERKKNGEREKKKKL